MSDDVCVGESKSTSTSGSGSGKAEVTGLSQTQTEPHTWTLRVWSSDPSSRHHGRRGSVLVSVSDVLINRIDDGADGTRWRGLREGRCRSGRCS